MKKGLTSSGDASHDFGSGRNGKKRIGSSSIVEKQLLRTMSSGATLPDMLNGICSALDCQIGNVVSIISPPANGVIEAAACANAAHFGLHIFSSEGIVAENQELIGCLTIYSTIPRSPSVRECQLIDRAKCLAAIAIKLHSEAKLEAVCDKHERPSVRGSILKWPDLGRRGSSSIDATLSTNRVKGPTP